MAGDGRPAHTAVGPVPWEGGRGWRVLEPHLGGANLSLGISGPHKAKASPHCGVRQNGGGSLLCAGDCPGAGPKVTANFYFIYLFLTLLEPDLRPSNGTSQPPPQPVGSGRSWSVGWVTVERGHAEVRMGVRDAVPQASGSAPPKGGTRLALGCRRQTPPRGGVTAL